LAAQGSAHKEGADAIALAAGFAQDHDGVAEAEAADGKATQVHFVSVDAAVEFGQLDEDTANGEGSGFVGREGDGLDVEAFEDGIADAALGDEGDTGFAESGEVAISGANGDVEFGGDVFGAGDAAALNIQQDGQQSIQTIHKNRLTRR
jgi:hypothetical protein